MFEVDHVFVPINKSLHWSLVILTNPLKEIHHKKNKKKVTCVSLKLNYLDSLGHHGNDVLRKYYFVDSFFFSLSVFFNVWGNIPGWIGLYNLNGKTQNIRRFLWKWYQIFFYFFFIFFSSFTPIQIKFASQEHENPAVPAQVFHFFF